MDGGPLHGIRSAGLAFALVLAAAATCSAQSASSASPAAAGGVRADYRSQHFFVHTDLPAAEAKDLLERLEYMLGLIATYWGRPPQGMIECYVVKDLKNWPDGTLPDDGGRAMIAAGGGVTISLVSGSSGRSTVYACADRGTPQHESVHAYCRTNFGTSGPTWYSEGMAEMGQYWRKNDTSVQIHEGVVEYLRAGDPKTLNAIVNGNERTGDSWQNYAWRWALCHLLANNPNYAKQFRPLGLGILTRQPVSFEQTYGSMADEIWFEYLFFIEHLCNGYRVDLCSWDWKRKPFAMAPGSARTTLIQAARGWQPSGILVKEGESFEAACTGTWKIDKTATKALTADGDDAGDGKLVGIMFQDFQLSDEFEIGASGKFTPPGAGHLFLRCRDEWSSVGDNAGAVTVKITASPK